MYIYIYIYIYVSSFTSAAWGREPVVGVVYDPYADELFMAAKGEGVPSRSRARWRVQYGGVGVVVKVTKKHILCLRDSMFSACDQILLYL